MSEVREQNNGVRFLRRVIDGEYSSALLFVGPQGVGRRFSIRSAVRELFSKGDPNSDQCYQVDQGLHPDFFVLSPEDGKDIGIGAVRDMISKAYDLPVQGPRRFFVIDGADRLTIPAANAFLKTLEEPPATTQFFLLAEEVGDVLPTVRSRCGTVRFQRLSESFIIESLSKVISDGGKSLVYARLAEGSLGRALEYFGANRLALRDRVVSLIKTGLAGDLSSLFLSIDGFEADLDLVIRFLDLVLYDLAMLPYDPTRIKNLDIAEDLDLLRCRLGDRRIRSLQQGLTLVQDRQHMTAVNVSFHLKTCLASNFS